MQVWSVAARSGATPKSVVTTGNGEALALAWRKERSGYRNLILTISLRKNETQKRRNAETQKQRITTILATLMPSARVRRPRMSRFGGRATETSSDTGVDAAAGRADKRKAHELSRPVLSDLLQEGARQLQGFGIVDPRRLERLL